MLPTITTYGPPNLSLHFDQPPYAYIQLEATFSFTHFPLQVHSAASLTSFNSKFFSGSWSEASQLVPTSPVHCLKISFPMPPTYFPLRWESTGDQWWYASPIDYAAANGHYDLVRELLRLDANHLIKLTSLRRIRRLETVWDDDSRFFDVAKCRSLVARNLLHECETKKGRNSLIRAGYGGWLLYTAASAGDLGFVEEIIEREPLIVFGEGEYGVSDILYAAARGKHSEVFRLIFDCAISPRCSSLGNGELDEMMSDVPGVFKWEIMNRAIYAAARGGNVELLRELLGDCSDVLAYRDVQGSTILHAASGRGQVQVVKDLLSSYDIVTAKDNQGNAALHIAAYRGHIAVVEALVHACPLLASLTNNSGDTFLHSVVGGFRNPSFRRLDQQIELMKKLVHGKIVNLQEIINVKNNDGRTVLHMAILFNIHSELIELLMSVPQIDINIHDIYNMTPLDVLNQRPRSAASEILIKQLISAGGISSLQDYTARNALISQLKLKGPCSSPGTSFRISDAEILLYTGVEIISDSSGDRGSTRQSSCSGGGLSEFSRNETSKRLGKKKAAASDASRQLKALIGWSRPKDKTVECNSADTSKTSARCDTHESSKKSSNLEDNPTPLRLRFSKPCSLPSNKRTLSVRTSLPCPSSKKKLTAGVVQGITESMPHLAPTSHSPKLLSKKKGILHNEISTTPCSKPSLNTATADMNLKSSTTSNSSSVNQYFCFNAQGLSVENSIVGQQTSRANRRSVLSTA